MRTAGARRPLAADANAACSTFRCNSTPPSGREYPALCQSLGDNETTNPEFANGESRRDKTHAVDHQPINFCCRRYKPSTGTHAKRKHAMSSDIFDNFVRRIGQERMVFMRAILHLVDQRLRMLDAHAEGKSFGLEVHAFTREKRKYIARRMPVASTTALPIHSCLPRVRTPTTLAA